MGTYLKRFIYASLVHLGLAAIFGILNGTTDIGYFGQFAHTHFNLLGFMSMMIFGIGYFIIPRFNGCELKFPGWVPVHFWLGNITLFGMVIFRGLYVETGNDLANILFIVSASLQVLTIFMFITNVWTTLSPAVQESSAPAAPAEATGEPAPSPAVEKDFEVTPDTKVSDLIDRKPSMKQFLAASGFPMLRQAENVEKIRMMGITIGMAASNHGLDIDRLIVGIKEDLARPATEPAVEISSATLIGQIMENYPESRTVFQKHFGDGCFDCPGQAYESVDMACRMHGVDQDTFLKELQSAIG